MHIVNCSTLYFITVTGEILPAAVYHGHDVAITEKSGCTAHLIEDDGMYSIAVHVTNETCQVTMRYFNTQEILNNPKVLNSGMKTWILNWNYFYMR